MGARFGHKRMSAFVKDDSAPAVVAALRRRKALIEQITSAREEIRELDSWIRMHRELRVEVEADAIRANSST